MATGRPTPLRRHTRSRSSCPSPARFQWPRDGQHLCDAGSPPAPPPRAHLSAAVSMATGRPTPLRPGHPQPARVAEVGTFQWPRDGQHLCDPTRASSPRSWATSFNGHGTANTSATSTIVACSASCSPFQWPRDGQHLCDLEHAIRYVEPLRSRFNGHGTANTSATRRQTQSWSGIPAAWRFNGHGTANTSATSALMAAVYSYAVNREFQWPRDGQHLCDVTSSRQSK